ncbi:hypothetical protein BJ546DRAFT_1024250 [Cryomyces antarcticus]
MEVQSEPLASQRKKELELLSCSYILRSLVDNVPLSADGQAADTYITCVEFWNDNLYIGTSAAELLHFVSIPADQDDPSGQPTFILASRLEPAFNQQPVSDVSNPGVQQILLLPKVNKASILCNNTLTFYSLPELSPAFGNTKLSSCTWVGGLDQSVDDDGKGAPGVVIMICLKSRIRLVRIEEEAPRKVKILEFGGCLTTVRQGDRACVADSRSYALLDLENPSKNDLFPISSLDEQAAGGISAGPEDISVARAPVLRTVSSAASPTHEGRGHGRATSLGNFTGGLGKRSQESPRPPTLGRDLEAPEPTSRRNSLRPTSSPEPHSSRAVSPAKRATSPDGPQEQTSQAAQTVLPFLPKPFMPLKPHILSPTPLEFLVTIGTTPSEPGVGIFVTHDGDVVRGTIEFSSYPEALVLDGEGIDPSSSLKPGEAAEEGYVLAVMEKKMGEVTHRGIEIQRWDLDPGDGGAMKEWVGLDRLDKHTVETGEDPRPAPRVGVRTVVTRNEMTLPDISKKLRLRRLNLYTSTSTSTDTGTGTGTSSLVASKNKSLRLSKKEAVTTEVEMNRNKEEENFTLRLSKIHTRTILWSADQVWWTIRTPLLIRLDAEIELATSTSTGDHATIEPNRRQIEQTINTLRGAEARNEVEFYSLSYIRQKASLLLLMDLIIRTSSGVVVFEHEKRATANALEEGAIDPRVVLALLPILREEVLESPGGIWIQEGVRVLIEAFLQQHKFSQIPHTVRGPFGDNLLQIIKRYLFIWRRKKGFGSIVDEEQVFQTVDAALLRLLLLLDSQSPRGPAAAGSVRAELNGVVDDREHGVACFDRAVELLEGSKRLYVLSRLYQSRRLYTKVLATWRRVIDGEPDEGGEFTDGEQEVRKYLIKMKDVDIVEEYGAWLANRNPRLGVQVFADDNSRVKFQPAQAVVLLKNRAPGAVKYHLEHLVFGKKLTQYANDLINFYLDTVLNELGNSSDARSMLLQTYESYRALRPPKPTYRQFITENAINADWWQNRLRLLQLLGGSQDVASQYDVPAILARLAPYEQELVPEMIILSGRQGRHEEALRLLTHGLGDFDTAIRYCLLGGSSIFHPGSGLLPKDSIPSTEEQATLFGYLLHEFLRIENLSDRIERVCELLERFGGWFDLAGVLSLIPDSWSIELVSEFIISALRRLVRERSETMVVKALSGAQSLRANADFIDKTETLGPTVEAAK